MAIPRGDSVMDADIQRVKVVVFPDGRVDTENAALFVGLSPKTMAMMRSAGTGPKFIKRGRVFYYLEDLQRWLAEQPRVHSTAQARLLTRANCVS
jgi:hypothetical protein